MHKNLYINVVRNIIHNRQKWKQLKCPSTDGKKMWYIHTIEYYSAIKRTETELFVVRWMDLESVIQNEVSQKEKQISYINIYMWNLEKWYR